ncbi:MAG: flavin reductase family protein [Parafilimonas terrae]|nr:flavin reductase family protein [Parafilimonas terrae]
MHRPIDSAILYFGTPVVLISTQNEDGTPNLAPMSSAWWLGQRCVLGLAKTSKTTGNLMRTGQCVLNLPSESQVDAVDRLALTTGSDPVPEGKAARGYRFVKDKFAEAGLTPIPSERVIPPRVGECPVHMEAELCVAHALAENDARWGGRSLVLETRVLRVHVEDGLDLAGHENRVDPDRWRPLIMSFQNFYGLRTGRLQPSRLATIPEERYRA